MKHLIKNVDVFLVILSDVSAGSVVVMLSQTSVKPQISQNVKITTTYSMIPSKSSKEEEEDWEEEEENDDKDDDGEQEASDEHSEFKRANHRIV